MYISVTSGEVQAKTSRESLMDVRFLGVFLEFSWRREGAEDLKEQVGQDEAIV